MPLLVLWNYIGYFCTLTLPYESQNWWSSWKLLLVFILEFVRFALNCSLIWVVFTCLWWWVFSVMNSYLFTSSLRWLHNDLSSLPRSLCGLLLSSRKGTDFCFELIILHLTCLNLLLALVIWQLFLLNFLNKWSYHPLIMTVCPCQQI